MWVDGSRSAEPPISYFIQQAVENPNLISLAAGLVDAESLPAEDVRLAVNDLLRDRGTAEATLQYGTTQGYAPLREKICRHVVALDIGHTVVQHGSTSARGTNACRSLAGSSRDSTVPA